MEAQYGKKISEAAADDLIARAQEIIGRLASLPSETATPALTQSPCMTPALTPLEAIESLQACVTYYIEAEEIDAKIEESLSSKLQNAADSLGDEQFEAAIGELGAFINEIEAQRGKKISNLAADDLTAQARMAFVMFTPTPTLEPTLTPTEVPTNTPTLVPQDTETPLPTVIPSPTDTLLPTETLIPTETFTPLPTATLVLPTGPLTIDYTYDSLNRLKSAEYSDGRSFEYEYDINGNTLEKRENLGEGTETTTYTYDAANQLVTSTVDRTTWHYTYDSNGSLIEVLPESDSLKNARRYTYNVAGYLVKVETHDGENWKAQAEMSYTGVGARLTTSSAGNTTHYILDGQLPLTISADGTEITILYGSGPIAEKMEDWNYVLMDGTDIPRQLTNMRGEITLSLRYNPWGKTIETIGVENFDMSYISTLVDYSTGLIYVGNGQYFDPETGRYLTRGVNPNSPNPYVPWNPMGMLLGPLGLISIQFSRKKLKSITVTGLLSVVLVACWQIAVIVGVSLLIGACSPNNTPTDAPPAATATAGPGQENGDGANNPSGVTETPSATTCSGGGCNATSEPTPSTSGTVGIFGGSQGSGQLEYSGPKVPGVQMTAWTKAPEGYTLWYSQYPGYHDYRLADHPDAQDFWNDPKTNSQAANGYAGKPGQAHWAFTYANPASDLPAILVGYSAGADAAVLHAELRQGVGQPIKALVLLDPAFYSYDLDGQLIGNSDYDQKLNSLDTRILIVDSQNLWADKSSSKVKYCPRNDLSHESIDDDAGLVDAVYQWISTDQITCSR